jgi:hypothetical protein
VLFDVIFLSLFFAGWLFCAFIPWLVFSVATRGHAGLGNLALVLFAAVVVGLAIPFLGLDGWNGLWLSFAAAALVSLGLMSLRRLTAVDLQHERARRSRPLPEGTPAPEHHVVESRK